MNRVIRAFALAGAVSVCACAGAASPTAPSMIAAADTLAAGAIDFAFLLAFSQNGYEAPQHLEPVRRLPGPPRLYLRTEDDAGRAIDPVTLASTERLLIESAHVWSGERFTVAEVARGTGTRERVPGWLTIKWSSLTVSDRCGHSTVGVDGGFIEFYDLGACSCGMTSRIYPRVVRHELGHAMGYYHTDRTTDVMYGRTITPDGCDLQPSERERRHARYVYGQ